MGHSTGDPVQHDDGRTGTVTEVITDPLGRPFAYLVMFDGSDSAEFVGSERTTQSLNSGM